MLLLPAMTVLASQGSLFDRARALFLFVRCRHILDIEATMKPEDRQRGTMSLLSTLLFVFHVRNLIL